MLVNFHPDLATPSVQLIYLLWTFKYNEKCEISLFFAIQTDDIILGFKLVQLVNKEHMMVHNGLKIEVTS